MGSIRTCLLQEGSLYGINKVLPLTRRHVLWGKLGLVCYKKAGYMGSIRTCLLQEHILHGVDKDLSVTIRDVMWGQ
jgi:hypothetical protein